MAQNFTRVCLFSGLAALAIVGSALSQTATINIAGTYRCQAAGTGCMSSGATFTVTQTGTAVEAKNDKGAAGSGQVTSNITISMGPPWNMLGVIHEPNTIEWSNGTQWRKQ